MVEPTFTMKVVARVGRSNLGQKPSKSLVAHVSSNPESRGGQFVLDEQADATIFEAVRVRSSPQSR